MFFFVNRTKKIMYETTNKVIITFSCTCRYIRAVQIGVQSDNFIFHVWIYHCAASNTFAHWKYTWKLLKLFRSCLCVEILIRFTSACCWNVEAKRLISFHSVWPQSTHQCENLPADLFYFIVIYFKIEPKSQMLNAVLKLFSLHLLAWAW